MAVPKEATVTAIQTLDEDVRLLSLRLPAGQPLGFRGGQYIIVDSGIVLPTGKVAKRAYSVLSSDSEQQEVQLAVRRIGEGAGSNYMHTLSVGDTLRFSGPWGKLVWERPATEDAKPASPVPSSSSWILCTDTGITAALGLASSVEARERRGTRLWWWCSHPRYFLSAAEVRRRTGPSCQGVHILPIPKVGQPGRGDRVRKTARELVQQEGAPEQVFLSGDGDVLGAVQDELLGLGVSASAIALECFFNNPARKAP